MMEVPTLPSQILSINFNQSHSYFTLGTERGFSLYKVDPLEKKCERDLGGPIAIAVQMYESNLFGLVGAEKNAKFPTCKFVLWDDYKEPAGDTIVEVIVADRIVGVRINENVVALVTRRHSMLYSLSNMEMIYDTKTDSNPGGVCALSSARGNIFLCPGIQPGSVRIYDYITKMDKIVKCHEHPLKFIALNTTYAARDSRSSHVADSMFVTASEHGTLIKVFDVEQQTKLMEFRRGGDASEIYSVTFSRDSKCLAATSSKGTVHVYSLSKEFTNVSSRASMFGGLMSYFSSEWSPFSIEFNGGGSNTATGSGTGTVTTGTTATSASTKHVACVIPIGSDGAAHRLLVTAENGAYAVHDLQFKDTKSIAKSHGLLQDLRIKEK